MGGVLDDLSDALSLQPPQLAGQLLGDCPRGHGVGQGSVERRGRLWRAQVENGRDQLGVRRLARR